MRKSLLFVAAALWAQCALATPITLTTQLTGDPRSGNPDNLIVDVTISFDTTSNTANWTVEVNSPSHPTIKLGVFAFNLFGAFSDYTASNFSPVGWELTDGSNVPGSGTADFLFRINDASGPPNNNVIDGVPLTFTLTRNPGNFTLADFVNAPFSSSSDSMLGSGQLGAHLQSLTVNSTTCPNGGCSESGFAMGSHVPEPATLVLLGMGLAGLALRKRTRDRRPDPTPPV